MQTCFRFSAIDTYVYLSKARNTTKDHVSILKSSILNYLNVRILELSRPEVPGTDKPEGVTISLNYAPAKWLLNRAATVSWIIVAYIGYTVAFIEQLRYQIMYVNNKKYAISYI